MLEAIKCWLMWHGMWIDGLHRRCSQTDFGPTVWIDTVATVLEAKQVCFYINWLLYWTLSWYTGRLFYVPTAWSPAVCLVLLHTILDTSVVSLG